MDKDKWKKAFEDAGLGEIRKKLELAGVTSIEYMLMKDNSFQEKDCQEELKKHLSSMEMRGLIGLLNEKKAERGDQDVRPPDNHLLS